MVAEGLGTFFLVWAVVAVAVNPRATRDWAGLAIGGTLGFAVMIIGPLTGAALNPARWFGPALVAGEWDDSGSTSSARSSAVCWRHWSTGTCSSRAPAVRAATPETGPKGLRQDVVPPQ